MERCIWRLVSQGRNCIVCLLGRLGLGAGGKDIKYHIRKDWERLMLLRHLAQFPDPMRLHPTTAPPSPQACLAQPRRCCRRQ